MANDNTSLPTLRERADTLSKTMGCNCDLDNWEPQRDTGHSLVCRIDKKARADAALAKVPS